MGFFIFEASLRIARGSAGALFESTSATGVPLTARRAPAARSEKQRGSEEKQEAPRHPDRNAKQALDLLAKPLMLNADRVHEMPASDGGLDLDQAAEAYARELGDVIFDICLLGMGPDGHVASIFPEHPSSYAEGEVIPVRASPKPPPERISLTLPVINRSREVWFVVSGSDKAAAAKMALLGAGPVQVPAAGVSGTERTLWLLDRDAAAELPADLQQRGRI